MLRYQYHEWLQAFAVYISVIAKTQPHRISDLVGYQILILEASNECHNVCDWDMIDISSSKLLLSPTLFCSLCTSNPDTTDIHHKAVYCPYHLNQSRSRPGQLQPTRQLQPTALLS